MTDFLAPAPYYRSRLFWLGLTGLVLLLWFWLVFSPRGIFIHAGLRSGSILSFRPALEFTFSGEDSGPPTWEVTIWPLEEEDRVDRSDSAFKWDYQGWMGESIVGGRSRLTYFRMDYLSMRPWLPSVSYLVVWLGAVCGWQRHKARLSKAAAFPPQP